MTREQLIELVKKIQPVEGHSEEEIHEMVHLFIKNVPDPNAYENIFHSDFAAEEIVDKALAYKPIQL
jgi:hypothetical protein